MKIPESSYEEAELEGLGTVLYLPISDSQLENYRGNPDNLREIYKINQLRRIVGNAFFTWKIKLDEEEANIIDKPLVERLEELTSIEAPKKKEETKIRGGFLTDLVNKAESEYQSADDIHTFLVDKLVKEGTYVDDHQSLSEDDKFLPILKKSFKEGWLISVIQPSTGSEYRTLGGQIIEEPLVAHLYLDEDHPQLGHLALEEPSIEVVIGSNIVTHMGEKLTQVEVKKLSAELREVL
jgi:hypothetical protein